MTPGEGVGVIRVGTIVAQPHDTRRWYVLSELASVPEGQWRIAQRFIAGTGLTKDRSSPGGTADSRTGMSPQHATGRSDFNRPSGTTRGQADGPPSDESLGYCRASLRDLFHGMSPANTLNTYGRVAASMRKLRAEQD